MKPFHVSLSTPSGFVAALFAIALCTGTAAAAPASDAWITTKTKLARFEWGLLRGILEEERQGK